MHSATPVPRQLGALLCAVPLFLMGESVHLRLSVRNLVVITLDTTRADRLPAYGFTQMETPALDRLAEEGVVFEQAISTVPLTLPAHCSLFTGLLPNHHGVRDNAGTALSRSTTTLAEILRSRGFRTSAFVGSIVLGPERGLAQGFDRYSAPARSDPRGGLRRPANAVMNDAIAWIERQESAPFFTWIHLYDAHAPYALPEPYRTMYEDAPYLGAIAFADAQIGRLLETLQRHHLVDATLIVVAGDHGESLGDHGEEGHGIFLYESTVRVPMIVREPGSPSRRVADVTRLIDLMPTALDAVGVSRPAMDGVSLLPLMRGRADHVDLEAYSESLYPRRFGWSELRALRAGRFKFVSAPRPELYDLASDPSESHNVIEQRRSLATAMANRLETLTEPAQTHGPIEQVAPDAAERLSALGYVSRSLPDSVRVDSHQATVDPKDCIGVYNAIVGWVESRVEMTAAHPDVPSAPACGNGLPALPMLLARRN